MWLFLRWLLLALPFLIHSSWGFNNQASPQIQISAVQHKRHVHIIRGETTYFSLNMKPNEDIISYSDGDDVKRNPTRRNFFAKMTTSTLITSIIGSSLIMPDAHAEGTTKSTSDATITDKIYIEFKGLSGPSEPNDRIVIGLFGNDAPQPVSILKELVTKEGYKSKCKPLDTTRVLQKEQLEANKVYNMCIETEDTVGVNYDYSTVWRVIENERIDVGAVSGKFIARENPNFEDKQSGLKHDRAGVVSVRRGDESGYGFTIYPGSGSSSTLDEDNIVVGKVIEGMDVVQKLNSMPVVKNALAGNKVKNAPSRACRYGGSELFCNEQKPLKKVLLDKTGIL